MRGTTSGTSLGVYDDAVLDGPLSEAEQVPPSTGRSRSLQGALVSMDGIPPEACASWLRFADEAALASRGYCFLCLGIPPRRPLWGRENAAQISSGSFGRVPSQTRETGNEHLSVIVSFFLSVVYL